jgi:hypothetical protein
VIAIIWSILLVMGMLAGFVVFERALFHGTTRLANLETLEATFVRWHQLGALGPVPRRGRGLGWLRTVLVHGDSDEAKVMTESRRLSAQASRHDALLQVLMTAPPSVGMSGSIIAMMDLGGDPTQALAGGMGTTLAGICIQTTCVAAYHLLGGRALRIIDQVDTTLEQLETLKANSRTQPKRIRTQQEKTNGKPKEKTPAADSGQRVSDESPGPVRA